MMMAINVNREEATVPSAQWLRSEMEAKGRRRGHKYLQSELEAESGVSQSHISAIHSGRRVPDRPTIQKISRALAGASSGPEYARICAAGLSASDKSPFDEDLTREFTEIMVLGYGDLPEGAREEIRSAVARAARRGRRQAQPQGAGDQQGSGEQAGDGEGREEGA